MEIKLKINSILFYLPILKNYSAITLGNTIHVNGLIFIDRTLRHEFIHLQQIKDMGLFRFYWDYLKYFIKHYMKYRDWNNAYLSIPMEKEAYYLSRFTQFDKFKNRLDKKLWKYYIQYRKKTI